MEVNELTSAAETWKMCRKKSFSKSQQSKPVLNHHTCCSLFSPLPDFQSDNFAGESDCGFNQWTGHPAGGNLRKKTHGPLLSLEQLHKTTSTPRETNVKKKR